MKLFVALCVTLVAASLADDCYVKDRDVWFGDLYAFMSGTFENCKARCRSDSRCRAVVWFHWGSLRGKCHMKNGHHSAIRNHCAWCTSAFKPCIDQEGPCTAGKYKSSRLVCSTCPANTYSKAGAKSCTNCPAGQYSKPGAGGCTKCPAGQFNGKARGSCQQCPAGTFSGPGAASCTSCPAGHFSRTGASACSPCPTGSYNGDREGSCKMCPADTFNDEVGATECKECGEGFIAPEGSTSPEDCEMKNGAHCWEFYDDNRLTGMYGDAMTYEEANAACFDDEKCTGVTCRRRKGDDDECYLAEGEEHEEDRLKWYVYLKEC